MTKIEMTMTKIEMTMTKIEMTMTKTETTMTKIETTMTKIDLTKFVSLTSLIINTQRVLYRNCRVSNVKYTPSDSVSLLLY